MFVDRILYSHYVVGSKELLDPVMLWWLHTIVLLRKIRAYMSLQSNSRTVRPVQRGRELLPDFCLWERIWDSADAKPNQILYGGNGPLVYHSSNLAWNCVQSESRKDRRLQLGYTGEADFFPSTLAPAPFLLASSTDNSRNIQFSLCW